MQSAKPRPASAPSPLGEGWGEGHHSALIFACFATVFQPSISDLIVAANLSADWRHDFRALAHALRRPHPQPILRRQLGEVMFDPRYRTERVGLGHSPRVQHLQPVARREPVDHRGRRRRFDAADPQRFQMRSEGHGDLDAAAGGVRKAPRRVPGFCPCDDRGPARAGPAGGLCQRLPAHHSAGRAAAW